MLAGEIFFLALGGFIVILVLNVTAEYSPILPNPYDRWVGLLGFAVYVTALVNALIWIKYFKESAQTNKYTLSWVFCAILFFNPVSVIIAFALLILGIEGHMDIS